MENEKNGLSLPVLLSLVAGFFTLSGGLWHLGYWSTFRFNYFEYANLTDLFKSSFYPFIERIWIIIGILALSTSATFIGKHNIKIIDESLIDKNDIKYKRRIKNQNFLADLVIAICLFTVGTFTILTNSKYKYDILPIVISIALVTYLIRYNVLNTLIINVDYRYIFILLMVVYPTFNFFIGKKTSTDIIDGRRATIITGFKSNDSLLNRDVMGRPYLGSSSDYHFIYFGGYDVEIIKKEIVENFSISKEWLYRDLKKGKSYEERIDFMKQFPTEIDTTKTYYDPALKIQIDSNFRQAIRETLLKKVK